MKSKFIYFLNLILLTMIISCSRYEDFIAYGNDSALLADVKRFSSKKALEEQIDLFSSSHELSKNQMNSIFDSKNGLDTLVPNEAFRKCLNSNGEIIVGDSIYKITSIGTFFTHINYISEMRNVSETANLKELFKPDISLIKIGNVFVYNTFNKYDNSATNNEKSIVKAEIDVNQFPIKNMDNTTIIGKFLGNFFGSNKDGIEYINSERRINASLYSYNYVVYSEAGLSVKIQKKMWYGGWGKVENWSEGTTIGWKGIVIRIPIQFPIDYSQFLPYPSNTYNSEYIRLKDGFIDFTNFPFNIEDDKILICIPYLINKEISYANIQEEFYRLFVKTVKSEIDRLAEINNYKQGDYDYGMLMYTDKEVFVYIQNSCRWKPGPSQTRVFDKDWHFLLKYSSGDSFLQFVQKSIVASFELGHNELVSGEAYAYTKSNENYYGMRLYKKSL